MEPECIRRLTNKSVGAIELAKLVDDIIAQGLMAHPLRVPHEDCAILTFLVENFHTDLTLKMIEAGADVKQGSKINYQPLHAAAGVKDIDVFKALIERGASVHAKTTQGASVLHYALVDNLTEEMTVASLGAVKKPYWALKKKGMTPAGRVASGFEMFAQFAQGPSQILFALEKMEEKGLLSSLKEDHKGGQAIFASMMSTFSTRFGNDSQIVGYMRTFKDALTLEAATQPTVSIRSRPRF
jgi:hypothetical protein